MAKIEIKTDDKYNKRVTKNTTARSTINTDIEITEPPLITYYAKVIDNLTQVDITNYKNAMDKDFIWYYGQIHNGESEYIIQFDIWNNEPAFNHRNYEKICHNAENINLNMSINKTQLNDEEYIYYQKYNAEGCMLYARIYNEDVQSKWMPLNNSISLISNTTNDEGILYGNGDHCIVQTKLYIPNGQFVPKRYYFNVNISYNFE